MFIEKEKYEYVNFHFNDKLRCIVYLKYFLLVNALHTLSSSIIYKRLFLMKVNELWKCLFWPTRHLKCYIYAKPKFITTLKCFLWFYFFHSKIIVIKLLVFYANFSTIELFNCGFKAWSFVILMICILILKLSKVMDSKQLYINKQKGDWICLTFFWTKLLVYYRIWMYTKWLHGQPKISRKTVSFYTL